MNFYLKVSHSMCPCGFVMCFCDRFPPTRLKGHAFEDSFISYTGKTSPMSPLLCQVFSFRLILLTSGRSVVPQVNQCWVLLWTGHEWIPQLWNLPQPPWVVIRIIRPLSISSPLFTALSLEQPPWESDSTMTASILQMRKPKLRQSWLTLEESSPSQAGLVLEELLALLPTLCTDPKPEQLLPVIGLQALSPWLQTTQV